MESSKFDALVASIKNREFNETRTLFPQCAIIWPGQIPILAQAISKSDLHIVDTVLFFKLQVFLSLYTDALNGKLSFNEHYLNCFKSIKKCSI